MIRFTQVHETFRLAEIEALAVLEGIKLEVLYYSPSVRFSPKIFVFLLTISEVTILLCQAGIRGCSKKTYPSKHPRKSSLRGLGKRLIP
jgi:tRNA G10  N-methylase Trm11